MPRDNELFDEELTGRTLLLLEKGADFNAVREALTPLVTPAPFFDRRISQDLLWRFSARYDIAVVPVSPVKITLRDHANLGILAVVPERYVSSPGELHEVDEFPEILTEPYLRLGVRTAVATGARIRVALIDTGVMDHPDLKGRVADCKQFVTTNGVELPHGTLCAGIICGPRTYQGRNGYGVAPDVTLFDAQVMADLNSAADDTILRAIEWADVEKNAHVIVFAGSSKTRTGPNPVFEEVGRKLLDQRRLLIAAAGRASAGAGTSAVEHPANCQSIVALNSVDDVFRPMTSSVGLLAAGDFVDFAAVGDALPSCSFNRDGKPGYGTLGGTSAATAFAAGIIALWAQTQSATGRDLWEVLLAHAVHVPVGSRFQIIGSGVLKAPGSILP